MALTLLLLLQVREIPDLVYVKDSDDRKHKLDLYMPESEEPAPVLMWIHGGGWKHGDRRLYKQIGLRFAEAGIGFAAISYRLSPEVKHPAHVEDCAAAFAWLYKHVKEHGGDPDRLFVSGQSAGGHLSALLALDAKYLEAHEVPREAIKGVIPMSGVYLIPPMKRGMFGDSFGGDADVCADASPVNHVEQAKAPMLVITESDDNYGVRSSMERFRDAFEKSGFEPIEFVDAADRNHITIVTNLAKKDDDPQRTAMIEFVRKLSE